jgi:hypothetical protein
MTSKRNLGPVLALTGAGIAVAAVIAGFILVGGPGDARTARLDQKTYSSLSDMANAAQCAFLAKGRSAESPEEIKTIVERFGPEVQYSVCGVPPLSGRMALELDPSIEYRPIDDARVEICATFLKPTSSWIEQYTEYDRPSFKELLAPRATAGRQCYQLDLGRLIFYRELAHAADTARLARCAYLVSDDVQPSLAAAIDVLKSQPDRQKQADCDWTEFYDPGSNDSLTYSRLAANQINVCLTLGRKSPQHREENFVGVSAIPDFTFAVLNEANPSSGNTCFEIDVETATDSKWGHPIQ